MTISVFFAGEEVMEEVLQKNSDHGMRSDSGIIGRKAHPQTKYSLVFDAFGETIDESLVRQHSLRV
jgi:hypothetical protein